MQTMFKLVLALVVVIVAVVGIVFCSALVWINSDHARTFLLARIDAAIPGSIAIEGYRLGLLGPRLDLWGVTLHDDGGTSLAGFERLTVDLAWRPLWRREVRLERVLLQAPWADLVLEAASGLNLVHALVPLDRERETPPDPAGGGGLPVNIVCRSVELTGGRLSLAPADGGYRLAAAGIGLSGAGNFKDLQAQVDLEVADLRVESPAVHAPPARLTAQAVLDGDRLNVPHLAVTAGRTTARLKGSAEALTAVPVVDGMLSIDSRLEELAALFELAGDYGGAAGATLQLRGPLANPDAALDLTVDDGRIAGQALDRGRLNVRMNDRRITVVDTALHRAGGSIAVDGSVDLQGMFPHGFLDPPGDREAIAYQVSLASDIPDLGPWTTPWTDLGGALTGRAAITGRGLARSGLSVRAVLSASGRRLQATGMDRPVDAQVDLAADMQGGTIVVERLEAAIDSVTLTGGGRLGLSDRSLGGDLRLAATDLSRALAVLGIASVDGAGTLTVTATGTVDRPQAALNLAAEKLRVQDYTIGNLTLDADLDHEGRLNLKTLDLANRSSRVQGRARLRLLPGSGRIDPAFGNTVDLTLRTLSAGDFMPSPPLKGTVDGRLQIGGPLTSLQGELTLRAAGLSSAAAAIGDVDARLRWDDGTVHVEHLDLANRSSRLTAKGLLRLLAPGTLNTVDDPAVDLTVASAHLDPGDFIDGPRGRFTLEAALSGSVAHPSGHLTLTGDRVEVAGQPIASIALDARLAERRIWLDRLVAAVAPGETIEIDGWMDMDRTLALQATSPGIALANIRSLQERIPGDGVVRFDATARGRLDNPDIDGRLTVSEATLNDRPIDDMHLRFSLHDMRLAAAGDLNVALQADCDLRGGDFDLQLVFDDTETAAYFKAAGMPDLHGTLTGRAEAAGNIRDPLNASAQVEISALHLLSKQTSLLETKGMLMQVADRRLSIPEFGMTILSTGDLRLKGDARLDGEVDITAAGRIPLSAAGAFKRELAEAAGTIALDGRLSGTRDAPRIDARIDLERIALPIPGLVQKLHDLNGTIRVTDDTVRIDGLKGFLDTGSFALDGQVEHAAFAPTRMDLSVRARALPLEVPDTLFVLLNGDLTLTGSDRSAAARGEIVVLEGLYFKDVRINLLQLATTRQRAVAPTRAPLTIPYFDSVDLDIAIRHRQPFAVENNLAQLNISPDLKIGGTLTHPILNGRAQVTEGTVTFQKKTFTVQKGVIDFVNPYKTEAEIDIVSQAAIRSWTITLAIKGTPDNLDLQLSSVPAESDSDILSLVLFGRTAGELTAGEGGGTRTTGQIMAELIADTFGDDIKKSTGVDILQVEENGGEEEAGGVRVTVGKHLSDRMTVKYAVESKDGEIVQRAITEYKLLENILVSGFQDSKGIYGSELVFRIEFR